MSDLDQFCKSIDDLPLFKKNVDFSYLTCLNTFSEKIFSAFPTQLTCQLFLLRCGNLIEWFSWKLADQKKLVFTWLALRPMAVSILYSLLYSVSPFIFSSQSRLVSKVTLIGPNSNLKWQWVCESTPPRVGIKLPGQLKNCPPSESRGMKISTRKFCDASTLLVFRIVGSHFL